MQKPLILWGGVDINPNIYNKSLLIYTQAPDNKRDSIELSLIKEYVEQKIPVVGVCRGAQLLCAFNGGALFQHSIPHRHDHSIKTKDGILFDKVCAGHHQIMQPEGKHIVHAFNPSFVEVFIDNDLSYYTQCTPEVVWFPETKCLAIQPHPEWAHPNDPFVIWLNKLMVDLEINYAF